MFLTACLNVSGRKNRKLECIIVIPTLSTTLIIVCSLQKGFDICHDVLLPWKIARDVVSLKALLGWNRHVFRQSMVKLFGSLSSWTLSSPHRLGFLLWHYLLLLRFLLLCRFIRQISTKPIGTDRNRPESRPKLRSRHLVFSFFKANLPSMNRPRSAHVGRLGRVAGVLAGALWGLSIEGAALSLRASLSRPWASKINRFIQFENWLINPCFLILPLCKLIYITVIMCFMLLFSSFCWMLFHLNLGGQEKSEANLNELILPQRA